MGANCKPKSLSVGTSTLEEVTCNIACNYTAAFVHAKHHPSLKKVEKHGPNLWTAH